MDDDLVQRIGRMRTIRLQAIFTLISLLFAVSAVHAQATVETGNLDKIVVYGQSNAAEVVFGSTEPHIPIENTGSGLRTCTLTAQDGLFCLNGKIVNNPPNLAPDPVVNCEDAKLGLDRKKANTCTAMTIGDGKNMFLAGKNKGKTHSLIELVTNNSPDPCSPSTFTGATLLGVLDSALCAYEVASGRPLILDMTMLGDDVLALEGGKTVVAFLINGDVVEIASGKSDWGLIGPEQLRRISLLHLAKEQKDIILATTTRGRILAWDMDGAGPADELVPSIAALGGDGARGAATCPSADTVYGISVSATSNLVYVSDSEDCQVIAFEAKMGDDGLELDDASVAIVSTDGFTVPTGVTVAPGNVVDLSDCDVDCPIDTDGSTVLAELIGVQLSPESATGLTIFRVTGIPDCRYLNHTQNSACPEVPAEEPGPDDIIHFAPGGGLNNPASQRLNITPLLPEEIKEQFPNKMPPLLLAHYVRGQKDNGFMIDGYFGIAQEGVVFRDTFDGRIEVGLLASHFNGCEADDVTDWDPLFWDVLGTVSERHFSANDTDDDELTRQHVSTVINIKGCESSRLRGGDWSFKPYNLEPTPCTFNPYNDGVWFGDGKCAVNDEGIYEEWHDDAVNAKMLWILLGEFHRTLNQLACEDTLGENGGNVPLSTNDCMKAFDDVALMTLKLHKCWDATIAPKQSAGSENCGAFRSHLQNLEYWLDGISVQETSTGQEPDVANRLGELKARAATMLHVLDERFLPTVPGGLDPGFVEQQNTNVDPDWTPPPETP